MKTVKMDFDDNDRGLCFPRDEEDNIGNDRNVWQFYQNNHNPEQNSQEPFCASTNLVMSNIKICCCHTDGVIHRRSLNTNSPFKSLNTLVKNGYLHGTNIVVIILSISSASGNTPLQVRHRYNGTRCQVKNVWHDRTMIVMFPLSPPGSNTSMIVFGSGCCERIFEADISLRDNGAIRKWNNFTTCLL